MTAHQFFDFFRFIVNTKPVNDGAGGFIHPTYFNPGASLRNLMTTLSRALTDVMSQKWACETSITTFSIASRKSKWLVKRSADAKNTWPVTVYVRLVPPELRLHA
jgi:hypothetical protein